MHGPDGTPRGRECLSHVLLEVLVCGDVEAYAPVLEPLRLDLVRRARDRSYDDVGLRETFLQGQGTRMHDVPRVVARLRALVRVVGLLGELGVFLCSERSTGRGETCGRGDGQFGKFVDASSMMQERVVEIGRNEEWFETAKQCVGSFGESGRE